MREAAARAQCQNNLKQIALALHSFHDTQHYYPVGTAEADGLPPQKRLSWLASILPHMDVHPFGQQVHSNLPWDAEENRGAVSTSIRAYLCPAHPELTTTHTHYVGLTGIGADAPNLDKDHPNAGFFGYARRIARTDIRDGSSFTAAVMETAAENGSWAAGGPFTLRSLTCDETVYIGEGRSFGMKHKTDTFFRSNPVIANVTFADGSVRSIPPTVAPDVLRALVTIAGREEANPDF